MYTLEQRWEILRHYFENHGNVAEGMLKLRTDFQRREAPTDPAIDLQEMPILAKKIIFSGEAHFGLGGYVNKQNFRP